MTADIVNLNKFRKAREKAEADKRADENRVRFGRTKTEKHVDANENRARERTLDNADRSQRGVAIDDDIDPGTAS
jgi:Domain of unknown function (DUF4169)